jgi:hypothetical protein
MILVAKQKDEMAFFSARWRLFYYFQCKQNILLQQSPQWVVVVIFIAVNVLVAIL